MQIGVNAMDKFSFTSVSAHTDHVQIKLRDFNREEESEGMEELVLADGKYLDYDSSISSFASAQLRLSITATGT